MRPALVSDLIVGDVLERTDDNFSAITGHLAPCGYTTFEAWDNLPCRVVSLRGFEVVDSHSNRVGTLVSVTSLAPGKGFRVSNMNPSWKVDITPITKWEKR